MEIAEILTNLGYHLRPDAKGWRSAAIYRDGDNQTALLIFKNGYFIDFVTGDSGDFNKLVQLTLGLETPVKAEELLKNKYQFVYQRTDVRPQIETPRIYDVEMLKQLKIDHSYWIKRGISEKTLLPFKGGVALSGQMKNRYVFPIFNLKKQLVGFSGRDIFPSSMDERPKWKHLGGKTSWVYPGFLNWYDIQGKKRVILVESIGDMLALFEVGISTVFVLFGTNLGNDILNALLKLDPKEIVIALNNDASLVGNEAAEKVRTKLLKFFDHYQVKVRLPPEKDLNLLLQQSPSKLRDIYGYNS